MVIVGAGSAGCVLANRLSSAGLKTVLLEAGTKAHNPIYRIPLLSVVHGVLVSKKYNWRFFSEPEVDFLTCIKMNCEPTMHQRQIYQPRGKHQFEESTNQYLGP